MSSTIIKVAVLDDYQKIAFPYFDPLPKDQFEITLFTDTLLPYNHPSTTSESKSHLVSRLKPFQIICTMRERTPFPKELLQKLPNLKLLLTTGLRNASIDLKAAKELGIPVGGATGRKSNKSEKPSSPDSTTQHAVALILGVARHIATDDAVVKSGGWQTGVTTSLAGKTFGTVGLGRLGINTAKIMSQSFGMNVIAWSTNLTQDIADKEGLNNHFKVKAVSKEELFRMADVVSIHLVLSERSRGIIGLKELEMMKKSAFIVNTSRGPLIQEDALLKTLKAGKIRGAALDVFDLEPLPRDSEWRTTEWGENGCSQVLLSPHMGYVEEEMMSTWYKETIENIKRWHAGQEILVPLT